MKTERSDCTRTCGPWHSEVGFEVLYWIPLLNWLVERHGIERERMLAVTRGGAGAWYRDLCASAVDAFDFYSPEEVKSRHERRVAETRSQKQMALHDLDRELLERVRERLGGEPVTVIHPSLMYHLMRAFWARRRPISFVERHTSFKPLPEPVPSAASERALAALPDRYVAVKAYFSSCFPDTPANRHWLADLVAMLARNGNVVLLSTRIEVDDHPDYEHEDEADPVFSVHEHMTPRDNLAVQTSVIAGAQALFTTYGGFSYLGPFLGVTSYSFYSHQNFNLPHLDVMARAEKDLRRLGREGGFHAFDVRDGRLLQSVAGVSGREARA